MWATGKQTESLQLGELKRTQARCTNMLEEKKKPVGSCEGCKADGVSWKTRLPHFSAALGARLLRARSLNYSVSLMSSSRPWTVTNTNVTGEALGAVLGSAAGSKEVLSIRCYKEACSFICH